MYEEYNNQNAYYMDEQEPNKEKGKKGYAITALVLGIVSIVCGCCGLGFIAAPISIIFGIIVLAKKYSGKGMAIAGIIMSAITIVALIFLCVMYGSYAKDYIRFSSEATQVIEDYEETGELPDYLDKYNDDDYSDFWESAGYDNFTEFFDAFIEEFESSSAN
jgi:hypothetical protein